MSPQPGHRGFGLGHGFAAGRPFAIHHDHRQAKRPGGAQLAVSSTGVLRHQHLDAVALHQAAIGGLRERDRAR